MTFIDLFHWFLTIWLSGNYASWFLEFFENLFLFAFEIPKSESFNYSLIIENLKPSKI